MRDRRNQQGDSGVSLQRAEGVCQLDVGRHTTQHIYVNFSGSHLDARALMTLLFTVRPV